MALDLWTSRRDCNLVCEWWQKDENDYVANNEIVYQKTPKDVFRAKEVNTYTVSAEVLAETYMMPKVNITIKTYDDIHEMCENDIVRIDGVIYRVESVQKSPFKNRRYYNSTGDCSAVYWISLRG